MAARDRIFECAGALLALAMLSTFPGAAAQGLDIEKVRKARDVSQALAALGVQNPGPGNQLLLEAPDIAVAGDLVSIRATSKMPGTDLIAIIVESSGKLNVEFKEFPPGIDHALAWKVELTRTTRVRAFVRASGRFFEVRREVKLATLVPNPQ
jgi:sulfur-oxidizing protein SoxY